MLPVVLALEEHAYAAKMMKPKAFSYIRMSTDAQMKGDSLRRQLELSELYAAANGLELAADFDLKDLGVSAFTGDNILTGALGRFLAFVRAGEIPVGSYLLVESLDRLSREAPRLALPRFLDIVNAGIVLVTLADNRKYTIGDCRLEELLYSLVVMSRAHEESATKSHRLKAAWKNKRESVGDKKLTARCPAWLALSDDRTTFTIIKERKAVIARIFVEANSGMGAYTIARRLNHDRVPAFKGRDGWHTSSINKLLTNRAVIGEFQPHKMLNGKRNAEGQPRTLYFPGIIEEEVFYAAQTQRLQRRTSGGGRRGEYISNLFSKLARCHYCRGPMRFENKGGRSSLVCDKAVRGKGCRAIRWDYQEFETAFLVLVEEIDLGSFFSTSTDAVERAAVEQAIAALNARIEKSETERTNAYALLELQGADLSYVSDRLIRCEADLAGCRKDLTSLIAQQQQSSNERSSYYESKTDLKDLIARIRSRGAPDTYKLRALIAARLRSVVSSLTLSPAGGLPVASWDTAPPVQNDPSYGADLGQDEPRKGRYFTVCFRDGKFRTVFPKDDDAFEFHQQISSGGSEHCLLEGGAGLTEIIDLIQFRPECDTMHPDDLIEQWLAKDATESD
jgi:DNA invertase Pin-like site-specific DNA recombinase